MRKPVPVHPYLVATFPILFLFSNNINEVYYTQIVSPVLVSLGVTFCIVCLSGLIYRSIEKSSIIASVFLILFFSYGHVFDVVENRALVPSIDHHQYLLIVWSGILVSAAFFIKKVSNDLGGITSMLNIAAFSLVAMPLSTIGIYEFKERPSSSAGAGMESIGSRMQAKGAVRDIYYIILDGYARSDILSEIYGYDNQDFIDYLIEKGFRVPAGSHSNYALTSLSLTSSLNMEYVNYMTDTAGAGSRDREMLYEKIENNKAAQFLKSKGYKFFHFGSGWGATHRNRYADLDFRGTGNEFEMVLVQTSMLTLFEKHFNFNKNKRRKRMLEAFSRLARVPETEEPTFTFAHFILPHPPYLFDANGGPVPKAKLQMDGIVWKQKANYVNQLIFTNKKIRELVDEILSGSEIPPIIVLQGDHGSASTFSTDGAGWNNPSDLMVNERMSIFGAYYLPSNGDALLTDDFTPINTFRLIFNHYFDADYKWMENRVYYSTYNRPYGFMDVTGVVRKKQATPVFP